MRTVRQLLEGKKPGVITIDAAEPVRAAIQLMADHFIGALPVLETGRLAGIVSERDYARKVVLMGRKSTETTVGTIMSAPVIHVGPAQTVNDCMKLMTEKRIRHLPGGGERRARRRDLDRGLREGGHRRAEARDRGPAAVYRRLEPVVNRFRPAGDLPPAISARSRTGELGGASRSATRRRCWALRPRVRRAAGRRLSAAARRKYCRASGRRPCGRRAAGG